MSDINLNSPVDYSTDRSKTLKDTTSSEDECQGSSLSKSNVVSSRACIVITEKLSSLRLFQALLDCGAEQSKAPDAKRHHTTLNRRSIKLRKTLLERDKMLLHNAVIHQLCFDS